MGSTIREQLLKQQKEKLTILVRQGRYDDARQFAREMKHPRLDDVFNIIAEVEQKRKMIMTQEIQIPTDNKPSDKIIDDANKPLPPDFPVHPRRVMSNRYGWGLGIWLLVWILGLRSFRLFQNYIKMEYTLYAVIYGVIYFWIVGIFIFSIASIYNVLITAPFAPAELIISMIGILLLPLAPYAFSIVQVPVFNHWHNEFRYQHDKQQLTW